MNKQISTKQKQKGARGITLIALVITIIVLLILAGVSIAMLTGENGILTQAQTSKERTEIAEAKERAKLDIMEWRTNELAKGNLGTITNEQIKTILTGKEYVKVEEGNPGAESFISKEGHTIVYKDLYTVQTPTEDPVGGDTSGANHPELKGGMVAITFNADGTDSEVADYTKRDWYSYEVQTGATDTYNEKTGEWGTSHWANAKLNGNYYVWIPRYAYKIDKSVEYETQGGGKSYKIDVIFLDKNNKKTDGTEIEGLITDYKQVSNTKNATTNYVLHPAFTFGTVTVDGAEIPNELSGIWVGKYETSGLQGSPTILPNQTPTINSVKKMFNMAKNVLESNEQKAELDAHMVKNIEWGAVAYLAQSQYGRNGTEISDNQCENMITGAGKTIGENLIYESSKYSTDPTTEQKYNGKIGKLSSTTGNIYGIYDMAGGCAEYVMGFYGTAENTPTLGSTGFTTETLPERKYYDLYINKTSADITNIGDALYETEGWNNETSLFVASWAPVLRRTGPFGRYNTPGASGGVLRVCITVI